MIDFNKHVHVDIDIFINDKWRKYATATLQNYKAT